MREALDERVSRVQGRTAAHRVVVDDGTLRGYSARTEAWVDALLVAAGPIASAVSAYEALRPTGRRGSSKSGDARANRLTVRRATMTVRSAGGWVARLEGDRIYLTIIMTYSCRKAVGVEWAFGANTNLARECRK